MSPIKYILAATLLFSSLSYAEEKSTETLTEVIEAGHFIVNWSPDGVNLGRAIIYRCPDCSPSTMTFDKNTEFLIDQTSYPIENLSKKTDWTGDISVTNQAPNKIIRITIY
jgi:hypothetical protein